MKTIFVFLLGIYIIPSLCWSQSFEWEGYGKGLTYLKIKDGHVTFNCCEWPESDGGKLKEVNDEWIIYQQIDFFSGDTINFKIQVLDKSFDSLRTFCEGNPVTFYKPEFLKYVGRYLFQDIKLEYIDNSRDIKNYKIEFNRFGRIRFADFDNITLYEETLNLSFVDQFKELIRYIDMRNLEECGGRQNNCMDDEISFLFRDTYYEEYSYRAIDVPELLKPVKEFLENILKSKGHPVEWPRRNNTKE